MAPRITDNVIIIDSGMNNRSIFTDTAGLSSYHITAISFWFGSTAGNCIISASNTASPIARFSLLEVNTGNAGLSIIPATQTITFSNPLRVGDIKAPALTAGTAWIYLA